MNKYDFKNMEENQIITLAQQGTDEAMAYILEHYKGLVRILSRPLFLIDGDKDDLIQEGMIGLFKAVNSYNETSGASFETFATHCINRQMYSAIKQSNRQKNIPLNSYISIYSQTGPEGQESGHAFLVDQSLEAVRQNPEEIIIDQENTRSMQRRLYSRLSDLERKVLHLYLQGISYQEIAARMEKTPKAIDNALQRIKHKLQQLITC
ncbi:MAG: sigma-70 family RNA polymerase sigma factor [Lachnospiraceae bacterium]|nr:sigma-70 family RNA polymerase sigma factor [Lachnospiraceae bacterium]